MVDVGIGIDLAAVDVVPVAILIIANTARQIADTSQTHSHTIGV